MISPSIDTDPRCPRQVALRRTQALCDVGPGYRPRASAQTDCAGGVRPVALWNVRPGRARAKPPKDPVQHPVIIDPRHATWPVRQQRFNDRPSEIRQIMTRNLNLQSFRERI